MSNEKLKDKVTLLFNILDENNDKRITREEFYHQYFKVQVIYIYVY